MGSIGPIDLSNHVQTVEYRWSEGSLWGKGRRGGGLKALLEFPRVSSSQEHFGQPSSLFDLEDKGGLDDPTSEIGSKPPHVINCPF